MSEMFPLFLTERDWSYFVADTVQVGHETESFRLLTIFLHDDSHTVYPVFFLNRCQIPSKAAVTNAVISSVRNVCKYHDWN